MLDQGLRELEAEKEGPMLEFVTAPGDCKDPALAALLDQEELAGQVELFFRSHWNLASVQAIQARVLRLHSGKRCTLEITVKEGNTLHHLIGKTYTKPRHDICEYVRELWRAGFDRNSKFSTPQAFAYVPSLRLLLQEKIHGLSVREVFLGTDWDKQIEAAQRSALWLAHFHDLAPRRGQVVTPDVLSVLLEKWAGRLATLDRPLALKSNKLFRRLAAELPKLDTTEYLAGHSSYSADHVLLANDRTVAIDWDTYDQADPARDLARFIVATERLALGHLRSIRALDPLAEVFLETYVAKRGAEALPRLPFYRATICLKLAKHCAFSPRIRRSAKKVEAMLDEGIRVLGN